MPSWGTEKVLWLPIHKYQGKNTQNFKQNDVEKATNKFSRFSKKKFMLPISFTYSETELPFKTKMAIVIKLKGDIYESFFEKKDNGESKGINTILKLERRINFIILEAYSTLFTIPSISIKKVKDDNETYKNQKKCLQNYSKNQENMTKYYIFIKKKTIRLNFLMNSLHYHGS